MDTATEDPILDERMIDDLASLGIPALEKSIQMFMDESRGESDPGDLGSPVDSGLTWDHIRRAIGEIAIEDGEWSGSPMAVDHVPLVLEKRHPRYKDLNGFCFGESGDPDPEDDDDNVEIVNSWFSDRLQAEIYLYREDGSDKTKFARLPQSGGQKMELLLGTMGVSNQAWTVEAEANACGKLRSLIGEHRYQQYMLSGTFLETSRRSRLVYMFRKLRPTVAMRATKDGCMEIRSVLCLHSAGYYDGTWAGVMVPTDDIIVHLMMMRADEHYLWKKCNHHNALSAMAGL